MLTPLLITHPEAKNFGEIDTHDVFCSMFSIAGEDPI
jgi:hypothetical protein